jgi:hypothetical protein
MDDVRKKLFIQPGLPDFSGYNIPKYAKSPLNYVMSIKYTKELDFICTFQKVIKCTNIFHFQDPKKFTQIGILGLKINHLATLDSRHAST